MSSILHSRVPMYWVVGGGVLNVLMLIAPIAICGRLATLLMDPVLAGALGLSTFFCVSELVSVLSQPSLRAAPVMVADIHARRLATVTGLLIYALFCGSLLHRSGGSTFVGAGELIAGTCLVLMGALLRAAAVRRLGVRFRTEVSAPKADRLTQDGIYGWIRHPSETGLLAATCGICLFAGWTTGWMLWLLGLLPLTLARITLEDRGLEAAFGDGFRDYRKHVPPLLPGWH